MRDTAVEAAPASPATFATRLQRRWPLLARSVWIGLVVLTLAICFASFPVYLTLLQTPCAGSACEYQQLTPEQLATLTGMGVSSGVYVGYTVALTLRSEERRVG